MSTTLIGLENIPNVYITKIKLSDNNTDTFNCSVFLQVQDAVLQNGLVWSDDKVFYNHLRVCLIRTTNKSLRESLKSGVQNPMPYELINAREFNPEETQFDIIPICQFIKSKKDADCYYNGTVSFEISFATENLTVFAFCFQDTKQLSQSFQVDLGGPLKNYFGAVTSEKIIENKVTPSSTSLFIRPNNEVWAGPVHLMAGIGFMEGSFHSGNNQEQLRELRVQNIKLSDNRTFLYRNKKPVSRKNNTIISDLYYAITKNVNLSATFSLNLKQLALQKTKHGKDFMDLSAKLFQEFLSTIAINSISIARQQVKTLRVANPVGSPKVAIHGTDSYEFLANTVDKSPNNLKNVENLQQIYLDENFKIRHYQFFDTDKNAKTKGQFAYKVEITIIDKSQDFIKEKIREVQRNVSELKDMVNFLNNKKRFDYNINQLKENIEPPIAILDIIRSYYLMKSYFNVIEEFEINHQINQRLVSFLKANYTPTVGEKLIKDYESLMNSFMNKFKVDLEIPGTSKPRNNKKAFIPNLVTIEKQFQDIIQFSDYRRFYDYLDLPDDITAPMHQESYISRSELEKSRFFKPDASRAPEEFSTLDDSVSSALTDLGEAARIFLSPLKFNFDSEQVSLKTLSGIDSDGLTTQFLKSAEVAKQQISPYKASKKREKKRSRKKNKSPMKKKFFSNKRKKAIFSTSFRIPKIKITSENKELFIDSTEYLGENSEFTNISGNVKTPPEQPTIKKAVGLMSSYATKTNSNKFNFDLTTRDSKVGSYITSKSFKESKLKKAPVGWKSLVCSRSPAANNEILATDGDILQNPETKITTEILFQTAQRVQILAGYDKDLDGDDILSSSIWIDMDPALLRDNGGVVCRMVYAEIPELGIEPSDQFKLPYLNKFFIIADESLKLNINLLPNFSLPASNINVATKNKLSDSIKFATTNVVTQNFLKDPFKKGASSPMESSTSASPSQTTMTTTTGGGY